MQDLDALFRRHGAMVYRRAYRILGDRADAEEATQEVFLKVMRGRARFEGRSSVTSWLYRITTNHCLNYIRDRVRRRELLDEHGPALVSEEQRVHDDVDIVTLRALLSEADEVQAQAAVYVYVDGMSYREAAELLGVSKRTVGNILERFHVWARKRVADDGRASSGGEAGR